MEVLYQYLLLEDYYKHKIYIFELELKIFFPAKDATHLIK